MFGTLGPDREHKYLFGIEVEYQAIEHYLLSVDWVNVNALGRRGSHSGCDVKSVHP